LQEYRAGECRCVCLNVDDERKCNADNDTKLWDSNSCVCACRENKECSTGLYFDQNSCKYVTERSRLKSQLREGLLGAGGTGKPGDIPTGRFDLGRCAEIPQRRRHISVSEVRRRRGEVPTISYKPLPVLPLQKEVRSHNEPLN
ncbi:unnamed protein product, partial [Timema podura]|nr:unnamed protein product [Timema podura]